MKLLLARHGETLLNVQHKFYGALDVPLDSIGQQQASQLADKLEALQITRLISSGLIRSEQTAAAVSAQCGVSVKSDSRFDEKGCGQWEGLSADEIQARDPKFWQQWLDDPLGVTPPEAESFAHFKNRVASALQSLINQSKEEDCLMVISHQGTARMVNQLLIPDDDYWTPNFASGSYTQYRLNNGKVMDVQRNL